MKNEKIKHKPEIPLCRIIREGCSKFCNNCGSTISKNGFLGIFGEYIIYVITKHVTITNQEYENETI